MCACARAVHLLYLQRSQLTALAGTGIPATPPPPPPYHVMYCSEIDKNGSQIIKIAPHLSKFADNKNTM